MMKFFKEIQRFIIIGLGSNVLNFIVYAFLYKIELSLSIAATCGYIIGLLNSFYFGKTWVFKAESIIYRDAIIKFILIYGIGGVGMVIIINILGSRTVLDYRLIWFIGALFAFINNYLGSKMFVFSKEGV